MSDLLTIAIIVILILATLVILGLVGVYALMVSISHHAIKGPYELDQW